MGASDTSQGFEPSRLRFHTENDALDYFRHIGEDCECMFVTKMRSFPERYLDGDAHLRIRLSAPGNAHVCQLTLAGVPFQSDPSDGQMLNMPSINRNAAICSYHRGEDFMDFSVSQLVQLPQGFAPSFVRLEAKEKGPQGLWNAAPLPGRVSLGVLASTPKGNFVYFGLESPPRRAELS